MPRLNSDGIFSVHKLDRTYAINNTFKVRYKVLKSDAMNSHRVEGKLEKSWWCHCIIHNDLGKGRYCR